MCENYGFFTGYVMAVHEMLSNYKLADQRIGTV